MNEAEETSYIARLQKMTGAELIFELESQWMDLWTGYQPARSMAEIRLIRRVLVGRCS